MIALLGFVHRGTIQLRLAASNLPKLTQMKETMMAAPLLARCKGIDPLYKTFTAGAYRTIVFESIEFDNDPNRVPGTTAGFIVLQPSSDKPSGNYYIRQTGYYRFKASVWSRPWPGTGASTYLLLRDRGTSGSDDLYLAVSNTFGVPGNHPSLALDAIVRVSVPNHYYSFDYKYLPLTPDDPASHDLETESLFYNFMEIEYLGPLS